MEEWKIILKHRLMDSLKESGALNNTATVREPFPSEWRIAEAEKAIDKVLEEFRG